MNFKEGDRVVNTLSYWVDWETPRFEAGQRATIIDGPDHRGWFVLQFDNGRVFPNCAPSSMRHLSPLQQLAEAL